jgi:uroporphyrinogen-III decarboxylase
VKEIHQRFSEWFVKALDHINQMDFDFYVVSDDLADTKAPFMDPDMFREFSLLYQKMVAAEIKKPWVFHSDGNLIPVMEDLLSLGLSGIHPIQPSAMNIEKLKSSYGNRVCLVGNIDLDYTLTMGTPEEVDRQVKKRIAVVGSGGGYIISSSNSLVSYCTTENVFTMTEAIRRHGKYPMA